jgi:hypothetical protein
VPSIDLGTHEGHNRCGGDSSLTHSNLRLRWFCEYGDMSVREEFGHVAGILVDSVDQLQEHICQGSVDASKTSGWTETHMFVKEIWIFSEHSCFISCHR